MLKTRLTSAGDHPLAMAHNSNRQNSKRGIAERGKKKMKLNRLITAF
jgi:hypothetical protein